MSKGLREQFEENFDYDEETLGRILSTMDAHNFKEIVYSWFSLGWSIGVENGRKDHCTEPYR